jgi:hypothetical protein
MWRDCDSDRPTGARTAERGADRALQSGPSEDDMARRAIPSVIAIASALVAGCSAEVAVDEDPAPRGTLVVRSGPECARGCALDRPVLVGSELIADVVDAGPLSADATARVADPAIAAAWVADVAMCCDRSDACRPVHLDGAGCAGEVETTSRITIRALAEGETLIEIVDPGGAVVAQAPITVADAREVVVLEAIHDVDRFRADVRPPLSDGASAWIDGRLRSVQARADRVTYLRAVALHARGTPLMEAGAIRVDVEDPEIARPVVTSLACSGAGATSSGDAIAIEGVSSGSTVLTIAAGSARTRLDVLVAGSCESTGTLVRSTFACATDTDCAPADCCHPGSCVALAAAPTCEGASCTLECREGTLDCGGRCLCLEGTCAAYVPPTHDPACVDDTATWMPVPRLIPVH